MFEYVGFYRVSTDPLPIVGFFRIRNGIIVVSPDDGVVHFVLMQAVVKRHLILKYEKLLERAIESHLLSQSPVGGVEQSFAISRVAIASIAPEPATVIFSPSPLLQ